MKAWLALLLLVVPLVVAPAVAGSRAELSFVGLNGTSGKLLTGGGFLSHDYAFSEDSWILWALRGGAWMLKDRTGMPAVSPSITAGPGVILSDQVRLGLCLGGGYAFALETPFFETELQVLRMMGEHAALGLESVGLQGGLLNTTRGSSDSMMLMAGMIARWRW